MAQPTDIYGCMDQMAFGFRATNISTWDLHIREFCSYWKHAFAGAAVIEALLNEDNLRDLHLELRHFAFEITKPSLHTVQWEYSSSPGPTPNQTESAVFAYLKGMVNEHLTRRGAAGQHIYLTADDIIQGADVESDPRCHHDLAQVISSEHLSGRSGLKLDFAALYILSGTGQS